MLGEKYVVRRVKHLSVQKGMTFYLSCHLGIFYSQCDFQHDEAHGDDHLAHGGVEPLGEPLVEHVPRGQAQAGTHEEREADAVQREPHEELHEPAGHAWPKSAPPLRIPPRGLDRAYSQYGKGLDGGVYKRHSFVNPIRDPAHADHRR